MNPSNAATVDTVCDAFEREWIAGRVPNILAALDGIALELRTTLAQQLMLVDAEYRRAKYGVAPSVDEYAVMMDVEPLDLLAVADTVDILGDVQHTPVIESRFLSGDLDKQSRPEDMSGYETNHDDSAPLQIGPLIPGYEILSELGRGGMGVVYKARQIRADRIVALKTIHAPHLASKEQVQRFQAEAKAAARLTHPNIVPVYDVDQGNGVHFFSMALVDGPNLETLAREQVLAPRAAAEICRDLADALEYAHHNGIIHRDVKPLNILMGPDHKPRLTDFGLARFRDQDQSLTTTGQIIGTATYMAPEQATESGANLGPTADIYALGATLYRCIIGRPPFQAATTLEVLRQVANDEPVRPRRLNQEIDADIETLCLKCLEKDPARRFQTAAELSAELSRYLNHEPIHSRPIGVMSRAWRWCRRRPTTAAALTLLTLLIFVMSTGVPYVLWQKSRLQKADLKKAQDARVIEQAESARKLEQAGRQQAEVLSASHAARAATQEYFVSIMKVRELQLQPDPKAGWTWEALDLLQEAATSDGDGKDPIILRSLIADTLMTPDLREIGRINNVRNTHALAVSHDGKLLAAGDYAGNPSQIRVYRIKTFQNDHQREHVEFELIRTCSVNTTTDYLQAELIEMGVQSGTIKAEGMWALDFSPDDKNIAVGTRNGNLTIWKIDCDPPQILFDKRFPERGTHNLSYSLDDRQIIVGYRNPGLLRVFDLNDQSERMTFSDKYIDFGLMPSGKILVSRDGHISRLSADSFTDSVEFAKEGTFHSLCTDRNCSVAIVGTVPSYLLNPITGEKGFTLQQPSTDLKQPHDITFAAGTAIAIGATEPQNLRLWDAISGQRAIDISYPGYETPLVCAGKEHDRIYVYSTVHTFAYQLRCAQPLQTDSGQTVPEPTTLLSNTAAPLSVFAPGAQSLSCFALSDDQQHIAVVETTSTNGLQKIPENYRARLRKLNVSDGQETERWTCSLLSSGENRNTLTEGDAVTFLRDDEKIGFTTPALGNIAVVSESGFEFPAGVGIDVTQQSPVIDTANSASWMGMKVPEVSATIGFRPAIALKLPRGLTQSKERLLLRLICGETVQQYDLADQHLDSSGWHLICLDHFKETFESGTWRVEATLVESNLQFDLNSGHSAANDESTIQLSQLYLLPSKLLKRGQTPPAYPMRLGPLAPRKDGGLAAVIESWTLHQWGPDLSESTSAPWRDAANNEEDIRGVCAGTDGYLVGTDSGLVALVKANGSQELIEGVDAGKGGYDSRDGVLATAMAEDADLAMAGTQRGQIKLYDLQQKNGTSISITDAHDREIVAMASTPDGKILATGSADGVLKLWRLRNHTLEFLFELTRDRNPVIQMSLSRTGDALYLLRTGERGVRRIDLQQLRDQFARLGIGWLEDATN